jgi:transposase-like protein
MSERAVPFHCPYCGDENLWPHEATHGSWECRSCLRAFTVKMLGQIRPPAAAGPASGGAS